VVAQASRRRATNRNEEDAKVPTLDLRTGNTLGGVQGGTRKEQEERRDQKGRVAK